ncbi:hypothetical protein [Nostoc sp.]|uniref:hypothetical protein n=1 Tax=Nostoc sp. TaxID=1180 RepID=UPI002FFC5DA7
MAILISLDFGVMVFYRRFLLVEMPKYSMDLHLALLFSLNENKLEEPFVEGVRILSGESDNSASTKCFDIWLR